MVKDSSYMFVTGPEVVKTVTHEEVTAEELGGALTHTTKSGVADMAFENDVEALLMLRRLYNYLPLNNREKSPMRASGDPTDRLDQSLNTLVPLNANQAYDMKELILKTVDDGDFFELQPDYAKKYPHWFCPYGRPNRGHCGQSTFGIGGLLGHKEFDQSGPLCALLRCLQYSCHHFCRRARFHAWHFTRIRRHHQARC
jgi:hypothetical protein